MKNTVVALAGVVCLALGFLSCDVGVTVGNDGGSGGGSGSDQGVRPEGDGGAADVVVECPAIAPEYPCENNSDCPEGWVCIAAIGGRPECGFACVQNLDAGVFDGGSCPPGSSGVATCHTDADCPDGAVCVVRVPGREECGTECRNNSDCPDYGAPEGQYCLRDSDCPRGERCGYFDPSRPECAGGCVRIEPPDGGTPDAVYPDAVYPDSGPSCAHLCDCPQGWVCDDGKCVDPGDVVGTVFCCDNPGCPWAAPCEHRFGGYDKCQGDADVGWPDAGMCLGEGEQYNRTGDPNPPECCPGLVALPALAVMDGGGCAAPGCDCIVCAKQCGNGSCSAGKNSCNCPQDCPMTFPGAPGSKCTSENDCIADAACLIEGYGYPNGGYCFGPVCDPTDVPSICPAGSVCLGLPFSQALGHCMPSCRSDADCRSDLTCEWMPSYKGTDFGAYTCWQGGAGINLGAALGEACSTNQDCISWFCESGSPDGTKTCSAPCDASRPCKTGLDCVPLAGCSSPQCGGCF